MNAFGCPIKDTPLGFHAEPATPGQLNALNQNREWRELTPEIWPVVLNSILEAAGVKQADYPRLNKAEASMLMDFWVCATPEQKRRAEKAAMDKWAGQGALL